jgi:hypothetical protein
VCRPGKETEPVRFDWLKREEKAAERNKKTEEKRLAISKFQKLNNTFQS